jgi:hypothetical protein
MKTATKFFVVTALCAASGTALGAVCNANATYSTSPNTLANVNLCGVTDQIVQTCANTTFLAQAPDYIYSVQLGPSSNVVFTVNGTGFYPYIALMSGAACNTGDNCPSNFENTGNPGQNISLPSTTGLPAGQYWLVITDITQNVTCPGATFTLSSTGTLPVKLQGFSVE